MARQRIDTSIDATDDEDDPSARLIRVANWKLFENLSWRLLRLLVQETTIDERALNEGDTFKITEDMDVVYVRKGEIAVQEERVEDPQTLSPGSAGVLRSSPPEHGDSPYRSTFWLNKGDTLKANKQSLVYVFYKRPNPDPSDTAWIDSNWDWLTKHSIVAREALYKQDELLKNNPPEVVLLSSKDLVEYLPPLTDLLAQAMAAGDQYETLPRNVCLVRFDPPADPTVSTPPRLTPGTADAPMDVITVFNASDLPKVTSRDSTVLAGLGPFEYDYIFVDPYDRSSDLAAVQVKTLSARARVVDPGGGVAQELPGTTLGNATFTQLLASVDSVVHVSRSFRPEPPVPHKLNFYAVVLDSRTARFESGGPREWNDLRNADEPLRQKIEPPRQAADPTTRLHLNLLRLKKGWEQSRTLGDVCSVLDEPNIPRVGDQAGFWMANSFFQRWLRDIQFRRVGVALGGGGATGFCHVALLQTLREQNIPIDLVSGTSFGALAGAYYCSHGLDGLHMLTEQALLLTGVASLTVLTSAFFEHLVNLSIDYRPMWELPIPFYAVATNIDTGDMEVFPGPVAANPSVGFAVRASGSLPGLFAPSLAGDLRAARYVDGSAVSVVPARALIQAGVDVVIGSNAFAFRRADASYRSTPLRGFLPPPFGRLAERVLAELNPANRMLDAARSLSLSLTPAMQLETEIASALYTHKRTDVKYWEFHRAAQVLREAHADLATSSALPAAINAARLLNKPVP